MTSDVPGPPTLVVGAGGLVGRAVVRAIPSAVEPPLAIPWSGHPARALQELAVWFAGRTEGRPWRVAWCAGAGVLATDDDALAAETASLRTFLDALASVALGDDGTLLLCSSAGGVHGGAGNHVVTEASTPRPLSAYGRNKLEQEAAVRQWAAGSGARAVIGRLTNVYGPGQDLTKPQGVVSRLVRASLSGQPLLLFVPLDTIRDYVFVDDAARRIAAALDRCAATAPGTVTVKIIGSGTTATIGELVAELHRVRKRRSPVVFGRTGSTLLQPAVLRFRSEVWTDIDRGARVTLAEGLAAVVRDQTSAAMAGAHG